MTRPRDSERAKLFKAEATLPDEPVPNPQGFAYGVIRSHWFRRFRVFDVDVNVIVGGGKSGDCAASVFPGGSIILPIRNVLRNRVSVIHAVTHLIAPENQAWHSPEFCRLELELVGQWMPELKDQLSEAFKANHVRLVALTAEEREAIRAAREAARERLYARRRRDLEAMLKRRSEEP